MPSAPQDFDIPEALAAPKRRWSLSLVWIIPIVAALAGGWLAVKAVLERGPTATVSFTVAEGLEAGKTKIKYKDVDIGLVTNVMLSDDHSRVIVTAQFNKQAESFLVEGTRFWVVRARVGTGGISGLGTLFSGSYIGVDVGTSSQPQREFTGLEIPPVVTADRPGRRFVLRGTDLGSLERGSPVYFRRVHVGEVVAVDLDQDGGGITVKIFVDAPFDKFVAIDSRFWHASGIDISLDTTGFKIATQSLATILIGGVAFQPPPDAPAAAPAEANTVFTLFLDQEQAMKRPDATVRAWVFVFDESVRGLDVGAPVDFRGVIVGEVKEIGVRVTPGAKSIQMRVEALIYAERLRARLKEMAPQLDDKDAFVNHLVEHGLRAQLKTGSLLTGKLYIGLDFFPTARPAKIDWAKEPPELPTVRSGLQELQATISHIASQLDKVPFDQIGADLRQVLQSLNRTLQDSDKLVRRLDTEVAPQARATLEEARRTLGAAQRTFSGDAPLQQDLREALRELSRTAQALRGLAEYLERHPESLIRGKKE